MQLPDVSVAGVFNMGGARSPTTPRSWSGWRDRPCRQRSPLAVVDPHREPGAFPDPQRPEAARPSGADPRRDSADLGGTRQPCLCPVRRVARRLWYRHRDRVLVQSPNGFEIVESMLACFRLGAVWVPANFRQSPDEVAWLAEKSEVSLMICDGAFPTMRASAAIGATACRCCGSVTGILATPMRRRYRAIGALT